MATTPTNKPIPSEDPRDLKFNAGKIDEVVTSDAHYYTDRFGVRRWTIAGLQFTAEEAIRNYGYITMDSFEDGATLTLPNQTLRYEANGEYYRWDGEFPKTVPSGSTPETSGGIGLGAWVSVGDASLRSALASENGALIIGNFVSSSGVISAKLYGVVSGVDCASVIQDMQDLSEELRLPIDFSGIEEVVFSGMVRVGDFFHWKSNGRFNTTIKPLTLTRTALGAAYTGSFGSIYAWFARKDPASNINFCRLENIGFDGQYQGGYEVEVENLIRAFCWHIHGSGNVGRDIEARGCHFKNCPHEAWEGYTTGGGTIDGIRYINNSSIGEDPSLTSVGFNAFKCMNGVIDAPGPYGTYTIKNIVSKDSVAFGHRTLTDLKRGCENWTIDNCQTYDMNDCHHSTDGSRFGTFTSSNIGIQTGASYRNKNFFELQAENVSIMGGTYKAAPGTSQAGQAGIFIADYKYPSETNYHQSKNIIIEDVNISNVNNHAVRLNNTANVKVNNITAEFCNGGAVSWELTPGHIDGVTLAEIVPSNNEQGSLSTRGCLTEFSVATGQNVVITGIARSAGFQTRFSSNNTVYQGNKPYTVLNPVYKNNDRLLQSITSSAPMKTDAATAPVSVPYAFTLNDNNSASLQAMPVARLPASTSGCVFVNTWVLQGTAPSAAIMFRELSSTGSVLNTVFLNAYVQGTWVERSYIYRPANGSCAVVEISLAPACDTSGTVALTGTTSFSDIRVSNYPI